MQDYNTIIGSIQMRLNGCQTRSVMDRYKIGSGTLNLIMSRYHANRIPIEELRMMAPKEVEDLFYPQKIWCYYHSYLLQLPFAHSACSGFSSRYSDSLLEKSLCNQDRSSLHCWQHSSLLSPRHERSHNLLY